MAITQQNFTLQLKRNTTSYASKDTALTGLKTALGATTAKIGEPMIAIYTEDAVEKVLLGIVSSNGKYTIFEGATLTSGGEIGIPEAVQDAIDAMDFTGVTSGSVITQVTQEDGKVSATAGNLTSSDKTVTVNGLDLAVNIDGTTIVKDSSTGKISVASKALTMEGEDAIEVEDGETGKTVKLNIASTDKVLSQSEAGLIANLELKYTKKTDTANGKIELIGKNNTVISTFDTADFTVDGFLNSVAWKGDGSNILVFTWNTDAGKTATEIDLTKYIDTYLAGNGLNLDSATKTFSVKVKDGDKYLTVDGDGVASKGIDEAIAAAVNALDAEVTSTDGEFVTVKVTEVDGKVTAVNVTESDIASASGTSAEITSAKTRITAIEEALGMTGDATTITPVDEQIDAKLSAITTSVTASTTEEHVTVGVAQKDGFITAVTVSESDIASASALTDEISARKAVTGVEDDTYTANNSTNYLKTADSLKAADEALDAALKTEADKISDLQTKVGETNVADAIKTEIEKLDVTDTADATKYVSAVSETDGKISVTRANLVSTEANNALQVDETNGGIYLGTTLDCGTY